MHNRENYGRYDAFKAGHDAANESIPLADLALRLARVVECLDGSLGNTLDCLEQNEDPDTVAIEIVQKAREQARKIACGEE